MSSAPPDLTDLFFLRWMNACERLRVDPFDLIRVSYSESGVRASAHNPNGHASGLIQFMPQTLLGLGWTKGHEAFRELAAEDQVEFVERYYRPYASWCHSDALCYVATFLPALLPKAEEIGAQFVLCGARGPLAWAYRDNPVLDRVKTTGAQGQDGLITVADLSRQLEIACRGARYDAIVWRLRQTMGLEPAPIPDPAPTEPELPNPASEPTIYIAPEDTLAGRREMLSDAIEEGRKGEGDS